MDANASVSSSVVSDWFGPRFAELHPLLQELHRHGGMLSGVVRIEVGRGLAGWLGRRLAKSLGVPVDRPQRGFAVEIAHRDGALDWVRRFDNGAVMASRFEPVGTWPTGYWLERTGAMHLRLTVDVIDGGWQWRPLRMSLHGLRLPMALLPRTRAGKRIDKGRYRFEVALVIPLFGTVLRYAGDLDAAVQPEPVLP